ncbi:DUF3159 domain-containing protein [Streptomyces angustmyceticus]|uniref:DUF3159 domain-containing protein n=1 Tax=Streptomyces angustmyceticus TaxID=285578 RepID=UPI0021B019E7|nr:DUF3159 domain-containing protein [Streptomyces angustmyceticus]
MPAAVRSRVRGTVLDLAPVFGFTLTFAVTHRLAVALTLALTAGVGVFVHRVGRRESVRRALGVLGFVCVQGALAARTGDATDFFLPQLLLHCAMAVASPVLILLGWPPLGVLAGVFTGEGTAWRRCAVRRRAFARGSLVLFAGKVLMLSVQIPLYLSGQAVALGSVDVFGPLVVGLGALLGWRVYRRALGTHRCPAARPARGGTRTDPAPRPGETTVAATAATEATAAEATAAPATVTQATATGATPAAASAPQATATQATTADCTVMERTVR